MSSSAGSGQHSDPVWQVCWVDRGLEQEERLVTISTDGRVTQWATTKVCSQARTDFSKFHIDAVCPCVEYTHHQEHRWRLLATPHTGARE